LIDWFSQNKPRNEIKLWIEIKHKYLNIKNIRFEIPLII
jgi:hypothetical protein